MKRALLLGIFLVASAASAQGAAPAEEPAAEAPKAAAPPAADAPNATEPAKVSDAPKKRAAAKVAASKPKEPPGDPPSLTVHDDLKLEGALTTTDVAGIVFDRHYALVDCYVRGVRASSRPAHVYLAMRIAPSGEVIAAGFEGGWPDDGKAPGCMISEVRRWRFPPAAAATSLTLRMSAEPGGKASARASEAQGLRQSSSN